MPLLGHRRAESLAAVLLAAAVPGVAGAADAAAGGGWSDNPATVIRASAERLTFAAVGPRNAKTFVVTKPRYINTFNAVSTTCGRGETPIARFSPDAHAGPTAIFTVTPLAAGACTIAVSDDDGEFVRVAIVVAPAPTTP